MFKITSFHRLLSFVLLITFTSFFMGPTNLFSQQQKELEEQEKKNPKIIFKKPISDSTKISTSADTSKGKIIFKKSYFSKEDEIRLISCEKFELYGEVKMVGEKGKFLIQAMGNNHRSIKMVNQAYKTKENGKVLMGLGVVATLATLLTIPYVEVGKAKSGGYVTTYYWLPCITIGSIIGGIGYSKYNSLEKKLDEAVRKYNEDLIIQKQDNNSK